MLAGTAAANGEKSLLQSTGMNPGSGPVAGCMARRGSLPAPGHRASDRDDCWPRGSEKLPGRGADGHREGCTELE